jgi:hypothetical protein
MPAAAACQGRERLRQPAEFMFEPQPRRRTALLRVLVDDDEAGAGYSAKPFAKNALDSEALKSGRHHPPSLTLSAGMFLERGPDW